jgi:hypothetical protein
MLHLIALDYCTTAALAPLVKLSDALLASNQLPLVVGTAATADRKVHVPEDIRLSLTSSMRRSLLLEAPALLYCVLSCCTSTAASSIDLQR